MTKTREQILEEDINNKLNKILETEISAEFHEFMASKQATEKEKAQFLVNRDAQRALAKQLKTSLETAREFIAYLDNK